MDTGKSDKFIVNPEEVLVSQDGDSIADEEEHKIDHLKALEEDSSKREHFRTQALRDTVHRSFKFIVYLGFAILAITLLVFVWHKLAPTDFRWLSEKDIEYIVNFGSGSFVTFILLSLRRYF